MNARYMLKFAKLYYKALIVSSIHFYIFINVKIITPEEKFPSRKCTMLVL